MKTNPAAPAVRSLADLSATERRKALKVRDAAALNDISEASFRRHFPHLIRKITARRDIVRLEDALTLPPPPKAQQPE
jgi:hypothetical protein